MTNAEIEKLRPGSFFTYERSLSHGGTVVARIMKVYRVKKKFSSAECIIFPAIELFGCQYHRKTYEEVRIVPRSDIAHARKSTEDEALAWTMLALDLMSDAFTLACAIEKTVSKPIKGVIKNKNLKRYHIDPPSKTSWIVRALERAKREMHTPTFTGEEADRGG